MGFRTLVSCFLLFISLRGFGCPNHYLYGKITESDRRYKTFFIALELCEKRHACVLVETGTARHGDTNFEGDGGSTLIFGQWAKDHNAKLFTVDINPEALERAQLAATNAKADTAIHFVQSDSIEFLKNFQGTIDFLYLDSYNFELNNPRPSQLHHLAEIRAAYPHLHKESIIMIDDCDLPHGGKGKYVIQYLKNQGWKVVCSGYQVIMVFEK